MRKADGADLWSPFLAAPARSGIFCDYDGTLAPIVDDPDSARPLEGICTLLQDLSTVYARVGVLTGRPVSFLESQLPDQLLLVGLYGLEIVDEGEHRDHPLGGSWCEAIEDVAAAARDLGPEGMRVEAKGRSVTLHYRRSPEIADDVIAFAARQAARSGLVCRPARMSVELHPPIDVDKGTALLEQAEDLTSACFIGDDHGDLPAFDALDELARRGVYTVRVVVGSTEAPGELTSRADVAVEGPDAVFSLLSALLPTSVSS
jgi:trehalose 6-phosphate phosphatase